jgi:hypothetical protein
MARDRRRPEPGPAIGLALLLALSGCALDPEPYHFRPIDEIPEGSGLFTGEQGASTITFGAKRPDGRTDTPQPSPRGPAEGVLPRPATHPPYAPTG